MRVKAVEFRGLACLTKYDIVRGVSLKATDKGIVIDVDSLRRSLSKNDFINNYRIDVAGGNLVVSVLEKRPAHVIGNAVKVMRIATGEEIEELPDDGKDPAAKALGAKGGAARAKSMTPARRAEIAKKAAAKRWEKTS